MAGEGFPKHGFAVPWHIDAGMFEGVGEALVVVVRKQSASQFAWLAGQRVADMLWVTPSTK